MKAASIASSAIEEFYEELAWHYSQSGNIPKAIDYLLKAGKKAKGMYANQEAIRYFERALKFIQERLADEKRLSLEMMAREALGDVLFTTGAHQEAEVQLSHALSLASKQQDVRHIAALTCKLADIIHWQGEYDRAIEMAESGLMALGKQIHCPEAANLLEVISRNEVHLEAWQQSQREIIGRGLLPGCQLYLRLERNGKSVSVLCSNDGKQWQSCGETSFPVDDPVWMGLYVACPAGLPGSVVRFKEFKLFQRKTR